MSGVAITCSSLDTLCVYMCMFVCVCVHCFCEWVGVGWWCVVGVLGDVGVWVWV